MTRLAITLITLCVALGAAYVFVGENKDSVLTTMFSQQTGYVVFATSGIMTGTELHPKFLGRARIRLKDIPKLAVSNYSDVKGKKATHYIPAGSFLTLNDFTPNPLSCAGAMNH
jgi:flagella basal body P-ring formation protein FlgA